MYSVSTIDKAIKTNGTNFFVGYVLRLPTFNITSFFRSELTDFQRTASDDLKRRIFFASGRNPPAEELCIAWAETAPRASCSVASSGPGSPISHPRCSFGNDSLVPLPLLQFSSATSRFTHHEAATLCGRRAAASRIVILGPCIVP